MFPKNSSSVYEGVRSQKSGARIIPAAVWAFILIPDSCLLTPLFQSPNPNSGSASSSSGCRFLHQVNAVDMYVYTTGVRYKVTICDTSSPPTTANPKGRRASPPEPYPKAIGIAPSSAAHV